MNRILIVEDDIYVSRMYTRVFQASGFEVEAIADGQAALNRLSVHDSLPSAILLDIIMPRMSGLDLLQGIKRDPALAKVPVIVLTNAFVKEYEEQFMSAGADLYLIKIENAPKEVVDKVTDIIKKKNPEQ